MNILVCGANDLKDIKGIIDKVAADFGTQFKNYIDGTSGGSNNRTWDESSRLSVMNADIIIYVIVEEYGAITWETEFVTAKNEGKQFLVFCKDNVWGYFLNLRKDSKEIYEQALTKNKVFQVLDQLLEGQFDIKPYNYASFGANLKYHLLEKFEEGIKSLETETKKKKISSLVKINDFDKIALLIQDEITKKYLYEILFDLFEKKEIRKRVLNFFSINGNLSAEDIIKLINDPEQGISRSTIELLPRLIKDRRDTAIIFSAAVEFAKNIDDVGTDRRIIHSLLSFDTPEAIKALVGLFPAFDIGTPKRILDFLGRTEVTLEESQKEEANQLISLCEKYNQKMGEINTLARIARKNLGLTDEDTTSNSY